MIRYVRWRVTLNAESWWVKARGYREACAYALRRHGAFNSVQRFNWILPNETKFMSDEKEIMNLLRESKWKRSARANCGDTPQAESSSTNRSLTAVSSNGESGSHGCNPEPIAPCEEASPGATKQIKKTACHCGKRLNENGLCWCCDPISTCWPK